MKVTWREFPEDKKLRFKERFELQSTNIIKETQS
jgi:hypothetical protein